MLHYSLLIGFLNTSLCNTVQKRPKIGHFYGRHNYMISNVKKVVSNVFSFGAASLIVKQPSSLLCICIFKMKSNFKMKRNIFNLQE